jgi:hypothetical protein
MLASPLIATIRYDIFAMIRYDMKKASPGNGPDISPQELFLSTSHLHSPARTTAQRVLPAGQENLAGLLTFTRESAAYEETAGQSKPALAGSSGWKPNVERWGIHRTATPA